MLNRNYYLQDEIEIVVKEMAEQVAARIRRHHCQTSCVSVYIGVAFGETQKGFSRQMTVPPTDNTKKLVEHCLFLFRKYYTGQVVRHVGITYSKLIYTSSIQLDLFADAEEQIKQMKLDKIIDKIRESMDLLLLFMLTANLKALGQSQEVNLLVVTQAVWMVFRTKGLIKINIISQYEQGYISYPKFIQEFPDSIFRNLKSAYLVLVALSIMSNLL